MTLVWKNIWDEYPSDAQTCWVRLARWNQPPFQATFNLSGREFTSDSTGVDFSVRLVWKWAPVS